MEQREPEVSIFLFLRLRLQRDMIVEMLSERPEFDVVGAYDELSPGALEDVRNTRPTVVLLEAPDSEGDRAIKSIRNVSSDSLIVVAGVPRDPVEILRYALAGASGYISYDAAIEEWCEAIISATKGEINNPVVCGVLNQYLFRLFGADGSFNEDIAEKLNVPIGTVKNHVHEILAKYEVSRRTQPADHYRRARNETE